MRRRSRASPPISSARRTLGIEIARRGRRRQLLSRHPGRRQGHRARPRRFDRHAGDGDERAGASKPRIETEGHPARALSAMPCRRSASPIRARRRSITSPSGASSCSPGGTGNPFFTTDTGAVLRAAELSGDAVMKATQVDGVYSADPKRDPERDPLRAADARRGDRQQLAVMDTAAFALARENRIPIIVFSIREEGAIRAALEGKGRATYGGRAEQASLIRCRRTELACRSRASACGALPDDRSRLPRRTGRGRPE